MLVFMTYDSQKSMVHDEEEKEMTDYFASFIFSQAYVRFYALLHDV